VLSQIPSRHPAAAANSAAAFPQDFTDSAGETIRLPTPFRSLAARYNGPGSSAPQHPVRLRLLALGARGLLVEQARQHVLAILATDNPCSAWFREIEPAAPAIFESLEFSLDDGPQDVVAFKSAAGELLFKHPYSAAVPENAGYNATVQLNANGPFFTTVADILGRDSAGRVARLAGRRELRVGPYAGNTLPARIATLLHELGHVIGRLPDDSDELSGLSAQNTVRVLHACHAEIKASVREHRDKGNEK
jgi:hypothetical protein